MNAYKTFTATYYRNTRVEGYIGPYPEKLTISATSKTSALKTARQEAVRRNWRFLDLHEGEI